MQANQTNQDPFDQVKAFFTVRKTSFNRFCIDNKVDPSNAKKAINGDWKGDKATQIRNLIAEATNINLNGEQHD
jgi:hypothetical protein